MLIVGRRILDESLLLDADVKRISNATYYLTIDRITRGDDDKELESVSIGPNEIVWVASKERFNLKGNNKIALVSLKSTFTKQGLLALDTGFVDPRFEGPIGTVIVNFSKNPVHIAKGEEFFRVIFIEHEELISPFIDRQIPKYNDSNHYIHQRKKEIVRDYGRTFLNIEGIEKNIESRIVESSSDALIGKMLSYVIAKYWHWALAALLVLCLIVGAIGYAGASLFTKAEIKEMVREQMTPKEVTNGV
jgi:deoxycytidine triphosphate deaminase